MAAKRIEIIIAGRDKASKILKRVEASVAMVGRRFAAFGTIAGAAAAAGLAVLTRRAMENISATSVLASRIGVATDALVGLRHAAARTGVDAGTFDDAIRELSQRLGEAKQDGGEAAEGFAALGLSIDNLLQMSPDQQFKAVAEAMGRMENRSIKLATAAKVFGDEGTRLVNTLDLGRKGIERYEAEAEKLGLTFSNIDAAQVMAANNALSNLGSLVEGIGNQLAIQLAPILEDVSVRLVAFGTSGEGVSGKVTDGLEMVAAGVAKVADLYLAGELVILGFKAAALQASADVVSSLNSVAEVIQDKFEGVLNAMAFMPNAAGRAAKGALIALERLTAPGTEGLAEGLQEEATRAAIAFNEKIGGVKPSEKVAAYFDDIRANARAAAEATVAAQQADGGLFAGVADRVSGFAADAKEMLSAGISSAFDAMKATSKRVGDLSRELGIERMKAAGDQLGVAIETLAADIDKRVAEAKTQREKDLIRQIGEVRAEQIRRQFSGDGETETPGDSSRPRVGATLLSSRFHGLAQSGAGVEPEKETAKHTKTTAEKIKEAVRELRQLRQEIGRNQSGRGGPRIISSF